jgi:hypothetical protein
MMWLHGGKARVPKAAGCESGARFAHHAHMLRHSCGYSLARLGSAHTEVRAPQIVNFFHVVKISFVKLLVLKIWMIFEAIKEDGTAFIYADLKSRTIPDLDGEFRVLHSRIDETHVGNLIERLRVRESLLTPV